MGAVARARVAEQPPEAPLARVAVARQEHESRAPADHKPAARAAEGPQAVPRGRPERVEAAKDEAAEDVVPPRDDGARRVRPQEIRRDAERRGARRAGRGDGYHRSTGPEAQRERARGPVVERRRRPTRARVARQRLLALLHAAERRPQDDGDAGGWSVEGRPRAQVVGRGEQELGRPAVSPSLTLELLDLAAEADAQVAHREALDARNAVHPGDEPRPERVEVGADRRDGPRRDDGDRLSAHRLAPPSAAAPTATFTSSPRPPPRPPPAAPRRPPRS